MRNKFQWNFNHNTKFFIHENASVSIICNMVAILSRGRLFWIIIVISNWTLANIFQWNFHQNAIVFIHENALKMLSARWRPFCLGFNVLRKKSNFNSYYLIGIGHVTLVAIVGTTILVPKSSLFFYVKVKSLQLIWRLGTRRFHLWLSNLQMNCRDLIDYTTGYIPGW